MRDRDLVRLHWPPPLRPAFDLVLAVDDRLAEVALGAREPTLGAIKIVWWRDSLAALDTQPPPPEPLLEAVSQEWITRGLRAEVLAEMADAWSAILQEEPDPTPRGQALFAALSALLGYTAEGGEAWSRADLARRTGENEWLRPTASRRHPTGARPIAMLDHLGGRDARRDWPPEPEATPGRSWALIRYRFTGR